MGVGTEARFTAATALGRNTKAMGNSSTALGNNTIANSSSSLVAGIFNDTIVAIETGTLPASTSPVFIVGNGTGAASRSNAFVVRRDARTGIATSSPQAQLHVAGTDGLLVTGPFNVDGLISINGTETRMFFNPRKAAFRAGIDTTNNNWDDRYGWHF
jgi:hypothetical protein